MAFDIRCKHCGGNCLPSDYCPVNDRTPAAPDVAFCTQCTDVHPVTDHAPRLTVISVQPYTWRDGVVDGALMAALGLVLWCAIVGFGAITGLY